MSAFRTVLGLSVVVIAAGCGGSTGSVSPMDGGGSGSGSSSGSSSGSGSGAEGDDSSVPLDDSGLPITGDDATTTPPGDDSGTTTPPVRDGGITTPPPGTDGGADQIACNGKSCDAKTDVCCVTRTGAACTAAAACMGDSLACTGSNSCPASGDVCCEEAVRGGGETSKCEKTKCPAGGVQLCTTNDDCAADQICRKGILSTCVRAPVTPPARDGGVFMRPDGGIGGGPGPIVLPDAGH